MSVVRNKEFEDYVDSIKQKSEDLIKNVFPKKIQELNDLLETPLFDLEEGHKEGLLEPLIIPAEAIKMALKRMHDKLDDDEDEDDLPPEGKKRKVNQTNSKHEKNVSFPVAGTSSPSRIPALPSESVPCNAVISKLIGIVKPQIRQLLEHASMLKMWVTFLTPKIEDGNNFGVSIQEDCLGKIRIVENHSLSLNGHITQYHMSRGKLISKVTKYPQIEEYRRVVAEYDESEFIAMKRIVSYVRNHYCALLDSIGKNFEKIIKPRTSNAENLY